MGLEKDSFTVTDDGTSRPIKLFDRTDEPVSLGILIDTSASMGSFEVRQIARHQPILDALSTFLQLSNSANEYFMISFGKKAELLCDWTRDANVLMSKIPAFGAKANTALYDALVFGLEKVKTGSHKKRAILLISDGQDNNSRHKFTDVRNLLRGSDVLLYSIGILSGGEAVTTLGMEGQGVLLELSELTGGAALFPGDSERLNLFADLIATELRHQYLLAFQYDRSAGPNKWHRLRIKVTPPPNAAPEVKNLMVRSRQGYYASAN